MQCHPSSRPVPIVASILVLVALVASACGGASGEGQLADAAPVTEAVEAAEDSPGSTDVIVDAGPASISLVMPVAGELEFSPAVKLSDQPFYDIIDLGLDCDTPSEPSNAIGNETYLATAHEGSAWANDVVYGFQFDTVAEAESYFDELAAPMQSCDVAWGDYESIERSSSTGPVQWVRIDPIPVESGFRNVRSFGHPVSVLQGDAFVFAIVDVPSTIRSSTDDSSHSELVDYLANNLGLVVDGTLAPREPQDISADPRAVLHTLMSNAYDNAGDAYFVPLAMSDVRSADFPSCDRIVRPRGTEPFDAIAYAIGATISGSGSSSSARPNSLGIMFVDVGADGDAQMFLDKLTTWKTECFSPAREWQPAERQTITTANGDVEIVTVVGARDDSLSTSVTIVDGTHGMEINALHGVDDQEFADLFIERRDFAIDALMSRPGR